VIDEKMKEPTSSLSRSDARNAERADNLREICLKGQMPCLRGPLSEPRGGKSKSSQGYLRFLNNAIQEERAAEESELVLCTVTSVLKNSVFVKLDEYDDIDGTYPISEVLHGRIRNIRDFVKEGKKIVCKVLKVNREKQQSMSLLRRVNDNREE
jgi:polyribonucleotide nucleotidyltransferase